MFFFCWKIKTKEEKKQKQIHIKCKNKFDVVRNYLPIFCVHSKKLTSKIYFSFSSFLTHTLTHLQTHNLEHKTHPPSFSNFPMKYVDEQTMLEIEANRHYFADIVSACVRLFQFGLLEYVSLPWRRRELNQSARRYRIKKKNHSASPAPTPVIILSQPPSLPPSPISPLPTTTITCITSNIYTQYSYTPAINLHKIVITRSLTRQRHTFNHKKYLRTHQWEESQQNRYQITWQNGFKDLAEDAVLE